MKKLLLLGGGGHCKSVLDTLFALSEFDQIGIVDAAEQTVLGVSVVGTDEDLPRLKEQGWQYAFVSVGSVGNTALRRQLYRKIQEFGFHIPTIVDPTAMVAKESVLKEGCFVGKQAIINADSCIGTCAIINSGAIVEHEVRIGDFTHISPGAVLCGQVKVGNDSHIGAGSVVKQQIVVGNNTIIGIGSVVVKDMGDRVKAWGNPCRVVESK